MAVRQKRLFTAFLSGKFCQVVAVSLSMDYLTLPSCQFRMLLQGVRVYMQPTAIRASLILKLNLNPDLAYISSCLSIGFVVGKVVWILRDSHIKGI